MQMPRLKPYKHICRLCDFYYDGKCFNCDSPGDVRKKEPEDICDGGGAGSEYYGFKPSEGVCL